MSLSKLRIKIKNCIHMVKAVDVNTIEAIGTNIAHSDVLRGSSVKTSEWNIIKFNSVQWVFINMQA